MLTLDVGNLSRPQPGKLHFFRLFIFSDTKGDKSGAVVGVAEAEGVPNSNQKQKGAMSVVELSEKKVKMQLVQLLLFSDIYTEL